MSKLLPPNATKLEKNLAQLGEKVTSLPVPFIDLHRIEHCPVAHLPWLAWQHRVEYWLPDWSEVKKRQAITDSKAFNQQRGTRSSISSLLTTVVDTFEIIAWHEFTPKQQPFTFVVNIPKSYMLTIEQLLQILTAVDATKSARDTYSVAAKIKTRADFEVVGCSVVGERYFFSTL